MRHVRMLSLNLRPGETLQIGDVTLVRWNAADAAVSTRTSRSRRRTTCPSITPSGRRLSPSLIRIAARIMCTQPPADTDAAERPSLLRALSGKIPSDAGAIDAMSFGRRIFGTGQRRTIIHFPGPHRRLGLFRFRRHACRRHTRSFFNGAHLGLPRLVRQLRDLGTAVLAILSARAGMTSDCKAVESRPHMNPANPAAGNLKMPDAPKFCQSSASFCCAPRSC